MSEELLYYYGSAENKLNSKGQVAIPARFRSVATDEDKKYNYVIVRGEGRCLYMYTHRHFGRIMQQARNYAVEQQDMDFFRRFMAEAVAVDLDTQGRFVLPQESMKTVGIKGPVVKFIGVNDRIEIWDPDEYGEVAATVADTYEAKRSEALNSIFNRLPDPPNG